MAESSSTEIDLDLSHYIDVLLRRRWIVLSIWIGVIVAVSLKTFTTKPVFQASTLLVIEKEKGGSAVSADGTMIESSNEDYYQTQYKLLKSQSLLRQVYDKLHLEQESDFKEPHGLQKLDKAIIVAPVLRSRLVYLKAESHDPQLAARIANSTAETFVAQNLANQLFISKEVLQALQISDDDKRADETYASLPAVVNNTLIQQLQGEYAKLQSQYADMKAQYTPKHPAMVALRANIQALQDQIKLETERIVRSLRTELSGQLKGNNVRIVDSAMVPEQPVRPRKLLALMLGFFCGGLLGFVVALLVEMLDQSIRTQEDVEFKLELPFLGLIPRAAVPANAPVYQPLMAKELSLTSEAFRNLRTMVDFASVSQKSQAFFVTSAVQEEGKTYVASNLAVAIAQLGERVLLIDGDLRRPSVHTKLRISSERGLSDFLAKGDSTDRVSELLQRTDIPNLSVLACGPRPPNPSELLNTPRVAALVSWAKANYDRVIIDCTPMFPINDTLLWGRYVSSGVFVIRYGKTRVSLIKNACQRLRNAGLKTMGVAINSAIPSGLTYASYGHYYQSYYQAYHREPAADGIA